MSAIENRVIGTLDRKAALIRSERRFEPGPNILDFGDQLRRRATGSLGFWGSIGRSTGVGCSSRSFLGTGAVLVCGVGRKPCTGTLGGPIPTETGARYTQTHC